MISRRAFVLGVAAAGSTTAAAAYAVRRPKNVLRVGVMSNLTHAPMIAGLGTGRIAQVVGMPIETRVFRAGPRVTEALIGDAIDIGTSGPAPVVVHHARHAAGGHGLRIIGGCCSGGASLVVTKGSTIASAQDLRGKRLAVTQIGTTQDMALRTYLWNAGLKDKTAGGDVTVLALAPATILEQMKRGELDGAWLPEPWGTRMVDELGARRFIDERSLWEGGRFATAILVARATPHPASPLVKAALEEEVARAQRDPKTTLREAHEELKRHMGNPGSLKLFEKAVAFVDYTPDPLRASIEKFGDVAVKLELCSFNPAAGLFY